MRWCFPNRRLRVVFVFLCARGSSDRQTLLRFRARVSLWVLLHVLLSYNIIMMLLMRYTPRRIGTRHRHHYCLCGRAMIIINRDPCAA
jgi:hypothetical protein